MGENGLGISSILFGSLGAKFPSLTIPDEGDSIFIILVGGLTGAGGMFWRGLGRPVGLATGNLDGKPAGRGRGAGAELVLLSKNPTCCDNDSPFGRGSPLGGIITNGNKDQNRDNKIKYNLPGLGGNGCGRGPGALLGAGCGVRETFILNK